MVNMVTTDKRNVLGLRDAPIFQKADVFKLVKTFLRLKKDETEDFIQSDIDLDLEEASEFVRNVVDEAIVVSEETMDSALVEAFVEMSKAIDDKNEDEIDWDLVELKMSEDIDILVYNRF